MPPAPWIERLSAFAMRQRHLAFLLALGAVAALISSSTILPLQRKTAALAEREAELDAGLAELEAEKSALHREVEALEADPYAIEQSMRQLLRRRRPEELPLSLFVARAAEMSPEAPMGAGQP